MPDSAFAFEHPDAALRAVADRLQTVAQRSRIRIDDCVDRVLAADVVADRDSPAADVSAMDGYAIQLADLGPEKELPISGQSLPGAAPPARTPGAAVRIFTGAIVPDGCEAVVKREDTEELAGSIRFRSPAFETRAGQHIRRAGENAPAGSPVLAAGTLLHPAGLATMANFGCSAASVYAPVRVSILTTGDEVCPVEAEELAPWQLRNSNRAALLALLARRAWLDCLGAEHCRDDRQALTRSLRSALERSDAVLLTGGVSMGDYDYVPDVVRECGGEIVFHGLPIRPGKPVLAAATGTGQLILGLPGNPVSATVGCRRMALPLLARIGGVSDWLAPVSQVRLVEADDKTIPLRWMRLVRLTGDGAAELVPSLGSGDLVSLGHSSGFVELPPHACGAGPWSYFAW